MSKIDIIKNIVTTTFKSPKVLIGLGFAGGVTSTVMIYKAINSVRIGFEEALTEIIESDMKNKTRSYRNYNSYSGYANNSFQGRLKYDDLIFGTRKEVEDVYNDLMRLDSKYSQVSVADLYDLVGISGTFADTRYGWKDLSQASVGKIKNGYVLNLPRPILLEEIKENGGK